jgi:hypothetical protein
MDGQLWQHADVLLKTLTSGGKGYHPLRIPENKKVAALDAAGSGENSIEKNRQTR